MIKELTNKIFPIRVRKHFPNRYRDPFDAWHKDGLCPDCQDPQRLFYFGPGGPGAQNICCGNDNCNSHWNNLAGLGLDRIRHIDHVISVENTNYVKHTHKVINNWHMLAFSKKPFSGPRDDLNYPYIFKWCKERLSGRWSVKADRFYFENKDDATFFKITWAK